MEILLRQKKREGSSDGQTRLRNGSAYADQKKGKKAASVSGGGIAASISGSARVMNRATAEKTPSAASTVPQEKARQASARARYAAETEQQQEQALLAQRDALELEQRRANHAAPFWKSATESA